MIARFRLWVAATWLALLVGAAEAHAGGIAECAHPFAFQSAEVNVVILPYFESGSSSRPLNRLGSQLALLVKLETLYRAMSYDRWGVVLLTGRKDECDPERIAGELFRMRLIRPGARLLVVWGKLYQQDDDVYVQTFAKAFRSAPGQKVTAAELGMQLGGKTFQANIGVEEFAFPPQQLSVDFIDAVADKFEKALFLYDRPTLTSTKHPIRINQFSKCSNCPSSLAFTVEGRVGNWIRVKTQGEGTSIGYLAARQDETNSLDQRMPEVSFLQGLMGFLRYTGRVAGGGTSQSSAGMSAAERALASYARREDAVQEPETMAAALQLSGILDFAQGKTDFSERFDAAYRLVPYSSHARNLAVVFRLHRSYSSAARNLRPRDIVDDFVAAAALDPGNPLVLANLQNFYELLIMPTFAAKVDPEFGLSTSEIQERLAVVKAIRRRNRSTNVAPVAGGAP